MTTAQALRASRACVDGPDCGEATALDPERLAKANISPATGLATDYLNHFNEAIMLLDLAATVPECLADLMAWRPMSYEDHFAASSFKERELAVRAYRAADPQARGDLERLATAMTAILLAARSALIMAGCAAAARSEAARAVAQLRPLVTRAGSVINGETTAQDKVDALFGR
jgi:hypothetical protein